MVLFFIGLAIGGNLGVVLMCCLAVSQSDRTAEACDSLSNHPHSEGKK
jgi:hypothetical protein